MKIESIYDAAFSAYGKVLEGYDTAELCRTLTESTPAPDGVGYVPSLDILENLPIAAELTKRAYGGLPLQFGWCNGHNTKLNCLEYHRNSEINCGATDFILLVARLDDMEDGRLDTSKVRAFRAPAGVVVEVYATTLHYAPCSPSRGAPFRVLIGLPRGTNGEKPEIEVKNKEDAFLWGCNKWLLAHAESEEASQGAQVALYGENIDISDDL